MVETVSTYSVGITIKKFFLQFFLVALIAALTWAMTEGLSTISLDYPQYAVIISLITAIIAALVNYIKHYQDTTNI